jgi:hypothetical protein
MKLEAMMRSRLQVSQGSTLMIGSWASAQVSTSTLLSHKPSCSCRTKALPFSSDAIRDYDGRFGRNTTGKNVSGAATETDTIPLYANDPEELLRDLMEGERLTVTVFQVRM